MGTAHASGSASRLGNGKRAQAPWVFGESSRYSERADREGAGNFRLLRLLLTILLLYSFHAYLVADMRCSETNSLEDSPVIERLAAPYTAAYYVSMGTPTKFCSPLAMIYEGAELVTEDAGGLRTEVRMTRVLESQLTQHCSYSDATGRLEVNR